MSKPKRPPGVARGDYVPLAPQKFGVAYATLIGVTAGTMPSAPDFPSEIYDAHAQRAHPWQDTPFNRAWYTSGKLFDDNAERMSFYWRAQKVMPLTKDRKYQNYVGRRGLDMHVALLVAVATVSGSERTTTKELGARLDRIFRERLAEIGPEGQVH